MLNRFDLATQDALERMGRGQALVIQKNGYSALLVAPSIPGNPNARILDFTVDVSVARTILESGLVGKLTENKVDCKLGWRELGLPGETHDCYCFIQ